MNDTMTPQRKVDANPTVLRDVKITWFAGGVTAGVAYMLLVVFICTRLY